MANILLGIFLALLFGGAVTYIIKEKKKGTKCIGCSMSENCSRAKKGGCKKNED